VPRWLQAWMCSIRNTSQQPSENEVRNEQYSLEI
jgi:hypothetical protein